MTENPKQLAIDTYINSRDFNPQLNSVAMMLEQYGIDMNDEETQKLWAQSINLLLATD